MRDGSHLEGTKPEGEEVVSFVTSSCLLPVKHSISTQRYHSGDQTPRHEPQGTRSLHMQTPSSVLKASCFGGKAELDQITPKSLSLQGLCGLTNFPPGREFELRTTEIRDAHLASRS